LKIKADENIGRVGVNLLREAGHDVMTVAQQGLSGAADEMIFRACASERRTLVTLDRDFGKVPRFPPKRSAGIVILELGAPATPGLLQARLRQFLALTTTRSVEGELWIIEAGCVRVHLEKDGE
jgi:predicted nuclease of predicted toxin-antitoxin system